MFLSGNYSTSHGGTYTVPAGYVAVIREINAFSAGSNEGVAAQGFSITTQDSVPIWFLWKPVAYRGFQHRWHGHTVVNAGEVITVTMQAENWLIRMSGYLLTLP